MDHSFYRKMAATIPATRVALNKTRFMTNFGITSYLTYILLGSTAAFVYANVKVYNPYTFHPKTKVYKAYPDYVNGTVVFYEKEVPNVIRNL